MGGEPQKAPNAEPTATNEPTAPSGKWGTHRTAKEAWIDLVDLAGQKFRIERTYRQTAGQQKWVFDLGGEGFQGKKASVRVEGSSIGDQIARDGLPPNGHTYTVEKKESKGSPTGYSLTLVEV